MFPPVNGIPKQSAEDTTIVVGNTSGGTTVIPCPKGSNIVLNVPGLHYNRTLTVKYPQICKYLELMFANMAEYSALLE